MKSQHEQLRLLNDQTEGKKPRFKIERLEERIAPAKGGVPGPPDGSGGDGHSRCHGRHADRGDCI